MPLKPGEIYATTSLLARNYFLTGILGSSPLSWPFTAAVNCICLQLALLVQDALLPSWPTGACTLHRPSAAAAFFMMSDKVTSLLILWICQSTFSHSSVSKYKVSKYLLLFLLSCQSFSSAHQHAGTMWLHTYSLLNTRLFVFEGRRVVC